MDLGRSYPGEKTSTLTKITAGVVAMVKTSPAVTYWARFRLRRGPGSQLKNGMVSERLVRRLLIFVSLIGLAAGAGAVAIGHPDASHAIWAAATLPVAVALALSIARDLAAGRIGVDVIALLAMSAALALGQPLAGIVVAIMYTGGTVLEDYAVARAERSLKALVDRAPRVAHRRLGQAIEDLLGHE